MGARPIISVLYKISSINNFSTGREAVYFPGHHLTCLDFYLCGRLKDLVYKTRPTTREDMIFRIQNALNSFSSAEMEAVIFSTNRRMMEDNLNTWDTFVNGKVIFWISVDVWFCCIYYYFNHFSLLVIIYFLVIKI